MYPFRVKIILHVSIKAGGAVHSFATSVTSVDLNLFVQGLAGCSRHRSCSPILQSWNWQRALSKWAWICLKSRQRTCELDSNWAKERFVSGMVHFYCSWTQPACECSWTAMKSWKCHKCGGAVSCTEGLIFSRSQSSPSPSPHLFRLLLLPLLLALFWCSDASFTSLVWVLFRPSHSRSLGGNCPLQSCCWRPRYQNATTQPMLR